MRVWTRTWGEPGLSSTLACAVVFFSSATLVFWKNSFPLFDCMIEYTLPPPTFWPSSHISAFCGYSSQEIVVFFRLSRCLLTKVPPHPPKLLLDQFFVDSFLVFCIFWLYKLYSGTGLRTFFKFLFVLEKEKWRAPDTRMRNTWSNPGSPQTCVHTTLF